ncbi:Uncharacterized protein TCM_004333 [Theobroma cacao]|uniref:Uncharacterized protein n=1 Tax=Theobroma cacao TaxID=3641 RepID=A0A061DQQ6_THECC|nr:Uncharacterized protein TCM_004333 [Theobroma cacao]
MRLVIRYGGQWVDGIYKGDVVGVNSEIHEIKLHALISTPEELPHPNIKDDEDVALILLKHRNVSAVYVTIKKCQTNVMSHEEAVQHDDGPDEWHDDSLDNDWLYDSDIPICNNVEGKTEPVGGVDVGDVQCDDLIYKNPIAGENGIHLPEILLDDSYQEKENVGISHTWLILGAERLSFQTITIKESVCADNHLYKTTRW